MYKIWWKFRGEEGVEHYAECQSVNAARRTWDLIDADSKSIMLCARP